MWIFDKSLYSIQMWEIVERKTHNISLYLFILTELAKIYSNLTKSVLSEQHAQNHRLLKSGWFSDSQSDFRKLRSIFSRIFSVCIVLLLFLALLNRFWSSDIDMILRIPCSSANYFRLMFNLFNQCSSFFSSKVLLISKIFIYFLLDYNLLNNFFKTCKWKNKNIFVTI